MAREHVRDGLPLRAEIDVVGYLPALGASASASTVGDWKCAGFLGPAAVTPAARAYDDDLDELGYVMNAAWARRVSSDPKATTESDLDGLRDAGYDAPQILAITLFISLRIAFSTVNDALGALPDRELHDAVPPQVRDVVTWGRPAEEYDAPAATDQRCVNFHYAGRWRASGSADFCR